MRGPAVAALLALSLAVPAAADTRRSETVTRGNVSATLTYVQRTDFGYRDTTLAVRRDGALVHSKRVPTCRSCAVWPAYQGRRSSVGIRDLDRDGELEVVVEGYTGGAHCCSVLYAYRWTGSTYAPRQLNAGSSGYRWADLDGDGRVEWLSADTRFEARFTAYANSVSPIRILTFRNGAFVAVTRSFPARVRRDEREAWALYRRYRGRRDVRGALAAWAADKYLLGEGAEVGPALTAANRRGELASDDGFTPGGAAYIRNLRAALAGFGYTKLD